MEDHGMIPIGFALNGDYGVEPLHEVQRRLMNDLDHTSDQSSASGGQASNALPVHEVVGHAE